MAKVKESSTRTYNKGIAEMTCPITHVMNKIGGYWKTIILCYLISGPKRYGELKRLIPAITEKMLIQHLKQLQEDNLINRKAEDIVPPYVVYSVTQPGEDLGPGIAGNGWMGNKGQRKVGGLHHQH
ncbi:helix-turn-helix transcriptional regulator [Chitinophaga filiformis]|uniref:winged helix-turn-helix transcriptional regulator n=1 Tax=Chitinophaga filiformis TaxID=104663 RepID=UPI001F301256|nr:helix-turn-helix domain-containing protein [Chitinophaga filiformis]MCF6407134.1 helix-turn-helix transcriptional regulator [Chitinophaga filiformis]